jgi:23S rRNA pseudouridine1911/1915/1917 synthase
MYKRFVVSKKDEGARLDKFLAENLVSFSRTKLSETIEEGSVLVNGKPKKVSYRLRHGDIVSIEHKEKREIILEPYPFDVKIIYEDQDVIVVDKPQDLVVHPPNLKCQNTLINALVYMGKELSDIDPLRTGVVHRLDKETSGILVLAKNNQSHLGLIKQFKERKVEKEYRAICWGRVKQDYLTIDLPLRRSASNRLKMKVGFLKSKKAFTKVEVLTRFKDSTFLSIKPITGRMHQIRVHLKFLGYPIVGDKKYGIKDNYKELFLHAYRLGFYHPIRGSFLQFESPLPIRFSEFIKTRENV